LMQRELRHGCTVMELPTSRLVCRCGGMFFRLSPEESRALACKEAGICGVDGLK
jgi:hypothetical protein